MKLRGLALAVVLVPPAEGKTRDQVLAAKPTADFDAKWGTGFINAERMTGLVYDSLP